MTHELLLTWEDIPAPDGGTPSQRLCVICGRTPTQGSHVIRRSQGGSEGPVMPMDQACHEALDGNRLSQQKADILLASLSFHQQATCVALSGWYGFGRRLYPGKVVRF